MAVQLVPLNYDKRYEKMATNAQMPLKPIRGAEEKQAAIHQEELPKQHNGTVDTNA
jgi:hypothetical protein